MIPDHFRFTSPAGLAVKATRNDSKPWRRARHLELINEKLVDLAARRIRRLAIFAPPRHGKSEIVNRFGIPWWLASFPNDRVILASHSATLASKFGMLAREVVHNHRDALGISISQDRAAKDNWGLEGRQGGMLSVGVGGSLIGEGAELMVFDDIISSAADALSETIRNSTMDWFESTAETRLNPGGVMIFMMQRWHADDPAQRIVYDQIRRWTEPEGCILNLPALAEENDILGRAEGEALWPEMWSQAYLEDLQASKPFWFASQYQQRPIPRGGGMFKDDWFPKVYRAPLDAETRVRWWDKASTEKGGDYTVGVLMAKRGDLYYVQDVIRGQWGSTERDRIIRATCKADNERYPFNITTWSEQEPGSAGKDSALSFTKMLAPYAAHTETSTGNKEVRADGFAGACGRGEVRIVESDWNDAYVQEMITFPGKYDDQVDASSAAYNKLALSSPYIASEVVAWDRYRDPVASMAGGGEGW